MSKHFTISISPRELFALQDIANINLSELAVPGESIEMLLNEQASDVVKKELARSKEKISRKIGSSSGSGYDYLDLSFLLSLLTNREIKELSKEAGDYSMPQDRLVSRGAGAGGRVIKDLVYEDVVDKVAFSVEKRFRDKSGRTDATSLVLLPFAIIAGIAVPPAGVALGVGDFGLMAKSIYEMFDAEKVAAFKPNIISILKDMRGIFEFYKPQSKDELVSITNSLFPSLKKELVRSVPGGKLKAIEKSRLDTDGGRVLKNLSSIMNLGIGEEAGDFYNALKRLEGAKGKGTVMPMSKVLDLDFSDEPSVSKEEKDRRIKEFDRLVKRNAPIIQDYDQKLQNIEIVLKDINKILGDSNKKGKLKALAKDFKKILSDGGHKGYDLADALGNTMDYYSEYDFSGDDYPQNNLPNLAGHSDKFGKWIAIINKEDPIDTALREALGLSSSNLLVEGVLKIADATVGKVIRQQVKRRVKRNLGREGADLYGGAAAGAGASEIDKAASLIGSPRSQRSAASLGRSGDEVVTVYNGPGAIPPRQRVLGDVIPVRRTVNFYDGVANDEAAATLLRSISRSQGKKLADDVDAALIYMDEGLVAGDEVVLTYPGKRGSNDAIIVVVKKGEGIDSIASTKLSNIADDDLTKLLGRAASGDTGASSAATQIIRAMIAADGAIADQIRLARWGLGTFRKSGLFKTVTHIPLKSPNGDFLLHPDTREVLALVNKPFSTPAGVYNPTSGILGRRTGVTTMPRAEAEAAQKLMKSWTTNLGGVMPMIGKSGTALSALAYGGSKALGWGARFLFNRKLAIAAAAVMYSMGIKNPAYFGALVAVGGGFWSLAAVTLLYLLGDAFCKIYQSKSDLIVNQGIRLMNGGKLPGEGTTIKLPKIPGNPDFWPAGKEMDIADLFRTFCTEWTKVAKLPMEYGELGDPAAGTGGGIQKTPAQVQKELDDAASGFDRDALENAKPKEKTKTDSTEDAKIDYGL